MGKIVHKVHCNAEILHGVQDFSLILGEELRVFLINV